MVLMRIQTLISGLLRTAGESSGASKVTLESREVLECVVSTPKLSLDLSMEMKPDRSIRLLSNDQND